MGKGKPSEIWKEIKPRIGDMVTAANDMEQSFDKAVREAYEKGYLDAAYNCHERCDFLDDEKKESYQRGLNDAWEAARKICLEEDDGGIPASAINDIFNVRNYRYAVKDYSASECIEKIRAYEQKQKEIQVGDEIVCSNGEKYVVFIVYDEKKLVTAFRHDGYKKTIESKWVTKTGRHFPEIAEVLQKMKENSNGNL